MFFMMFISSRSSVHYVYISTGTFNRWCIFQKKNLNSRKKLPLGFRGTEQLQSAKALTDMSNRSF